MREVLHGQLRSPETSLPADVLNIGSVEMFLQPSVALSALKWPFPYQTVSLLVKMLSIVQRIGVDAYQSFRVGLKGAENFNKGLELQVVQTPQPLSRHVN